MIRGYDSPELEALVVPEMRRRAMRGILTAALGVVAGGETAALRELQAEEGMDRERAERFIRYFGVYVESMAAAVERAGSFLEDVPALFAEELRRRRGRGAA